MKFSTTLTNSLLVLFSALATTTHATPVESRSALDVFTPPVLTPQAGTVWTVNSTQTVTWDVSQAPVNITNKIGRIQLRQGDITTSLILAGGFDILLGGVNVIVPWVLPSDDYSLVLFGDSGDFSDQFTISD